MFLVTHSCNKCRLILVLVLFALGLCQCAYQPQAPVASNRTREIIDDIGKLVRVPLDVTRVVSLAPNLTEIVYAVDAGALMVGNTTYCDYPDAAKTVEKVGDTLHPSIERLIALRPQVVLVSTASQLENFTQQMDAHEIAVFVTDPRDLEGVFRSIERIGAIVNRQNQAEQLVAQLRWRTASVEIAVQQHHPIKVFYQLSNEPLYTAGKDAFVTDLIRRAGGASLTAAVPGAWPRYSAESALAAQPEAIILPTGGADGSANSKVADALKRSPAALNGKIFKINADHLSRPGPRAVTGLEEIARALHPEAFNR